MNDLNYTALWGFLAPVLLTASHLFKSPYWRIALIIAGIGSFLIYIALTWGG